MTARLLLPSTNGQPHRHRAWDISAGAVRAAMDLLEIRHPVVLRFTAGYRVVGCHRWRLADGGFEHAITISGYRTTAQATHTLWHELVHAMQTERWADLHAAEYLVGGSRAGAFGGGCTSYDQAWAVAANAFHRHAYRPRKRLHEDEANILADSYGEYPLCHAKGTLPMAWWHSQPEGSTMQGNTTTCPDCGHTVSKGNLARHRRAQHSTNPGRTPQGIVAAIANTTETPPVEPPVETPEAPVPATPADLQAELDKLAPELEKYAAGYKAYKKARVAKKGAAGDELAKAEATMEKHHKAFTAYCRAAARKRSLLKAMPGGN